MNILITGIHGFVGANLVQALKANHVTPFGTRHSHSSLHVISML